MVRKNQNRGILRAKGKKIPLLTRQRTKSSQNAIKGHQEIPQTALNWQNLEDRPKIRTFIGKKHWNKGWLKRDLEMDKFLDQIEKKERKVKNGRNK